MSDTALHLELHDLPQGHALVSRGWEWSKQQIAQGKPVAVTFEVLEETRALRLNKEYWGYVLRPISEQAQENGIGSDAEGWHYYYKKMFLGYRFTKTRVPGSKRPIVRRELRSTTDLTNREMAEYMEKVRAHAATTFCVSFPTKDAPPRPAGPAIGHTRKTTIDMETGEILDT